MRANPQKMINFRLFSCVLVNLWSDFVAKIWCQEGGNENGTLWRIWRVGKKL